MHQPPYPPPAPTRPLRWGRFAAWTGAAAVAAFAVGGGLSVWLDDDTTTANPGSCKAALAENLRNATEAGPGGPTLPAPPACIGVDRVTLERITGEVITDYWKSPEADKAVEDAMRRAMESAAASP
ncbi:hypothetical protein SUDANB1_00455 [Streptomyces sp. enrichment culture]|uniref:hypothetical protein n=1 Tax=Streptomyces sp. enrichment culture TaxID=1795815 RepID=UPI003F569F38